MSVKQITLVPKLELSSLYTSVWDTVILAWMPESSHRDVKDCKHPALLSNMREAKVAVHGAGYRHPCRYDDSWAGCV